MNETILEDTSKYFWLVTGVPIRSIRQLIEIVPTLSEEQYQYHVNPEKNDFYNWIMGVFQDEEIADLIRSCATRDEFQEKLYAYLLAEKQRQQEAVKEKFAAAQKEVFKKNPERFKQFHEKEARREERVSEEFAEATKRIDESKKKSVLPETITRTEAMKVREKEMHDYIAQTRKEGHNCLLPDLAIKRLKAKLAYANLTENDADFDKAEHVLDSTEKELESVVMEPNTDAKKEVELLISFAEEKERKAKEEAENATTNAPTTKVRAKEEVKRVESAT